MYMKNVMYKIIMGCYIVAALVLVTACNDSLDIQQAYPFSIETLPVPKKLKVGETAEIRCQLVREGYYQPTTYRIRYFQPDGKGKLEMDNGTVFLPNDLYPLEKETFRLDYTLASTDQQTIDIYIIDSFGQMQQLTLSSVSYTHLDVYKRQVHRHQCRVRSHTFGMVQGYQGAARLLHSTPVSYTRLPTAWRYTTPYLPCVAGEVPAATSSGRTAPYPL